MRINLVFDDWVDKRSDKSVYHTEIGIELALGDFHRGTMFSAEIELEDYQGEFEAAAEKGIIPVFYVILPREQHCELFGESVPFLQTTEFEEELFRLAKDVGASYHNRNSRKMKEIQAWIAGSSQVLPRA